jgi:hypothetical protein
LLNKLINGLISFGLIGLFLTGCADSNSAKSPGAAPAYRATPGEVVWNDIKYTTGNTIKKEQLDRKLGVINFHNKAKYPVYSVKGYKITKEIAIELHNPTQEFVVAVNKK